MSGTWKVRVAALGAGAALLLSLAPAGRAQSAAVDGAASTLADLSRLSGARLMKSGVASQFDSLGTAPLGHVGDPVTSYIFTYNDALSRVVHARIVSRERFQPPSSWRAACDEVAHPGWFYRLTPASSAMFAVVVPGVFERPAVRPPLEASVTGAWQYYHATVDSAWQSYLAYRKPASVYASDYMRKDFWGPNDDGHYAQIRKFDVLGPAGRHYTAMAFALRDDYPDLPTTKRTWIVDAWGYPVASMAANIDIYGTVNDGGIDAVLTSSGLIRWDGTQWRMPPVYSEEPCLYHRTMPLPPGAHP